MAETLNLHVTGMTCGGCENAVKRALGRLDGVVDVSASHVQQRVDVTYDSGKVTPEAIRHKIETIGYQAHPA
jgi:copper chaperone CopZ